jgi:hypothetical protein
MYLGLGIAITLTFYIAFRLIYKNNSIFEGLENNDDSKEEKIKTTIQDIVTKIKKETEMMEDMLHIEKHRPDYEDMFLALEDYANLALIQALSMFANNPSLTKESSKTMIEGINHLNMLKTTLNDVMEFIDRKRASNKSTTNSFFGN